MSIFYKDCPQCATTLAANVQECRCGYSFEGNTDNPETTALLTLQEEKLYEAYLAARLAQTKQTADSARAAVRNQPNNEATVNQAAEAMAALKAVEAEYAVQLQKVADAEKMAESARREQAKRQAQQRPETVTRAPAMAVNSSGPAVAAQQAAARLAQATSDAAHMAQTLRARQHAPKVPAPISAPTPRLAAQQTVDNRPNDAFRAAQMAKAEQALKAVRAARQAAQLPQANSPTPSESFRATQAAKAAQVMQARNAVDTKECPNCTASVHNHIEQCLCGYSFPSGNSDLPSLSLSSAELSDLLGAGDRRAG